MDTTSQTNIRSLSMQQVERLAPSVFADHRNTTTTSTKYNLLSTIDVVNALQDEGWIITQARETRSNKEHRRGFQKHMLRFARRDLKENHNTRVELVLTNAHDGSAAFRLHGGLYRLVCDNGLMVSDHDFESIQIRHVGATTRDVIEASYKVIQDAPRLAESVESMAQAMLSGDERQAFARAALDLKYPDESARPIRADQLLTRRRMGDDRSDLYTTYNVVQENLIRGGLAARSANNRRTRTREIKSIDQDVKLNKALWTLATDAATEVCLALNSDHG